MGGNIDSKLFCGSCKPAPISIVNRGGARGGEGVLGSVVYIRVKAGLVYKKLLRVGSGP